MYEGGDVYKGGGVRMTQEVSPLEGRTQGTGSDLCMHSSIYPRPSPPPVFAIMQPPRARYCHMQ